MGVETMEKECLKSAQCKDCEAFVKAIEDYFSPKETGYNPLVRLNRLAKEWRNKHVPDRLREENG